MDCPTIIEITLIGQAAVVNFAEMVGRIDVTVSQRSQWVRTRRLDQSRVQDSASCICLFVVLRTSLVVIARRHDDEPLPVGASSTTLNTSSSAHFEAFQRRGVRFYHFITDLAFLSCFKIASCETS
jgi:hypothetical protein